MDLKTILTSGVIVSLLGGADGVFDGVALAAGSGIVMKESNNTKGNTRIAKAFNATGTTFLITEFK